MKKEGLFYLMVWRFTVATLIQASGEAGRWWRDSHMESHEAEREAEPNLDNQPSLKNYLPRAHPMT